MKSIILVNYNKLICIIMDRLETYERKIYFILEKIHNLPKNPTKNEFYLDALFYRLQNSIDAAMDIIAMLCKDLGKKVKDDYSNIESLQELGVFSSSLLDNLRKLNGLRNAIVHKYNKIEEDLILKNKKKVVEILEDFINKLEGLLNEKFYKSE